jgi:tetratricopeptide (TPR) repeat protein
MLGTLSPQKTIEDAMAEPVTLSVPQTSEGPFFRKLDWAAFWAAFILSLAVYTYTVAPTVTLEDCGELATGGYFLGVPHPPGYPFWSFLSYIFSRIFSFVTFRGQPNPSWSIAELSAVCGALATACASMLVCRSGADILTHSKLIPGDMDKRTEDLICWLGGVVSSLLFAFSPINWSQSVIVEVYSLNAFFLALLFLLIYRWMRRPTEKLLFLISYVFGLGLTNYQVLLLAIVPLVIIILLRDTDLFRDFAIMGLAFAIGISIIQVASEGSQPGFPKHMAPSSEYPNLLMDMDQYIWIAVCVTAVVGACIWLWFAKPNKPWPIVPTAALGIALFGLLIVLFGISDPEPIVPQQGQEVFSWGVQYLMFAGAIAVLIILCCLVPRGHLLAISLVTIAVTLAVMVRKGVFLGLVNPYAPSFQTYCVLDLALIALAWIMLPRGRTVAICILLAQLGVAFYLYEPIVSDLRNPPINWAYPRTWEGFIHAITRGQYEKITPSPVFSAGFVGQLRDFLIDLRAQFTLPMAILGFLPFTAWQLKLMGKKVKALYLAIAVAVPAAAVTVFEEAFHLENVPVLGIIYWTLTGVLILILFLGGLTIGVRLVKGMIARLPAKAGASTSERVVLSLVLLGIAGLCLYTTAELAVKFFEITRPLRETGKTMPPGDFNLVFWQAAGLVALIIVPLVATVMIAWLTLHEDHELNMSVDEGSYTWLIATLIGWVMLGVVLMVLASPKGDIQDSFIQRVKFISSHAIYSFWIGYGIILALAFFINVISRGNTVLKWLAICGTMTFALLPLYENAFNKDLVRLVGGAEMTGHDFGWQFGNYELRGAEAISEELSPDEEPLPNPEFPPEMGTNAIFYGGTDPGRFVPTYMIYCAAVREDVYLITQNALADGTYMNVMRDLYGDRIWIPAVPDSAKAFQRYVEEVQSKKRQANAELKIENGRVQVSGALGVMEINGILAEMIFERNNYKHPFYVEESYVIRWMYPYLTPHGLIMKINKDTCDLSPETERDDTDFWDWYTRRLMDNNGFVRDVCARKSFSKLRSAIAGLYAARGRYHESERAFEQARIIYPLSPEANFRLAQEALMPQSRFADARMVIEEFGRQDPGNTSVPPFVDQVRKVEDMLARINTLESQTASGQMDINNAFELAELYLSSGQMQRFMNVAENIMGNTNLPPVFHYRVATLLERGGRFPEMIRALDMCIDKLPADAPPEIFLDIANKYREANQPDKMLLVIQKYLQRKPKDWSAWLDLGLVNMGLGRTNEAIKALNEAIKVGGPEARDTVAKDPRFEPIRNGINNRAMDHMIGLPTSIPLN